MNHWLDRLNGFFNQVRRDPLRRYIYLLLWPWFIPVVSYLIFGKVIIADWWSCASGLVVVLLLCTVANEMDTYALLRIIRRYPSPNQSIQRLSWMVLLFGILNSLLAEVSLRLFDATRFLGYVYRSEVNSWVLAFVFISSVVAAALVESAYAFIQWQTNQVERQNLEQENLQAQVETLKSTINPHFLFNSLNSISSLIADEPQQAELFVNELSKVYRYLLQANKNPLVSLQAEIQFVQSYVQLLEARYGKSLLVNIALDEGAMERVLPPLSLQILIDDIIQHNALTPSKPLMIQIENAGADWLCMTHNRQPRTVLLDRKLPDLEDIAARYRWVGQEPVEVKSTGEQRIIRLPLLMSAIISSTFFPAQS